MMKSKFKEFVFTVHDWLGQTGVNIESFLTYQINYNHIKQYRAGSWQWNTMGVVGSRLSIILVH